ncbi:hypothetical protein [Acinetobacter calcoaceticus]|uniref:hypothetical protein n=1 Tax=Acinetobacter calcoaceticus TaxID=471 RepID=UPI001AE1E986|nr:hypothetical protein [Acinetobacter calcoaceticus]MBP2605504.1 hypothetical protein [Acinetobacter calcoaceticus]
MRKIQLCCSMAGWAGQPLAGRFLVRGISTPVQSVTISWKRWCQVKTKLELRTSK